MRGIMNSGTYEVEFDGSRHPSGVYLYRLQAGVTIAIGKMVLVR